MPDTSKSKQDESYHLNCDSKEVVAFVDNSIMSKTTVQPRSKVRRDAYTLRSRCVANARYSAPRRRRTLRRTLRRTTLPRREARRTTRLRRNFNASHWSFNCEVSRVGYASQDASQDA